MLVVIVDRKVSHSQNIIANIWNKMALPSFLLAHRPGFFEPYREALLQHIGLPLVSKASGTRSQKVVYIDRQSSGRRLEAANQIQLVELLDSLNRSGQAEVVIAKMETLPIKEQIAIVADADVSRVVSRDWVRNSFNR
jgi:hypothetical protein